MTDDDRKIVLDIYHDLSKAGSYSGPDKIHAILKSRGVNDIGVYKVRQIIQNEDSYGLQQPIRRKFKRLQVRVTEIDEQFALDLIDLTTLSKYNDSFKYVLVVMDVFSRFLWARKLKTKNADEVLKALKDIFQHTDRRPKKIYSDKGGEFCNAKMKRYLRQEGIKQYTSQNETKVAHIERLIKTLKNMMYRHFTKQRSYRYVDKLQSFVDSYNATPHRSLNNTPPNKVDKSNETRLWAYMYLKPTKKKDRMAKKSKKTRRRAFKFKVGDMVRLTYEKKPFQRSFYQNWTSEVFKISSRFMRQAVRMYSIVDLKGDKIVGQFYESEMTRVKRDQDSLWFIDEIIKTKKVRGKTKYFCSFVGFPKKFNMWLDEAEVTDVSTADGAT